MNGDEDEAREWGSADSNGSAWVPSEKEEAGMWNEVKPVWVQTERAAVRREAEVGTRSTEDVRGGIMVVGTEVSMLASGSPSAGSGAAWVPAAAGDGLAQEK
ncbi:hypothetical protein BGW80DRAFT_1255186 [Lactifluus volemus]|nr:hypothetical protein BGW80DRAFT_1255186 [Lactifluus volemus]